MVEHTRNDDEAESFDLTVRCPGVAFDVGQKGFTRVLVVQKLADTVTEYDEGRGDDEKGQLGYFKNALVGATPDDTVYQCVYLTDSPVGRSDLNDPKTRYPVPESRLVPFRVDKADPIDDSPQWSPAEGVQYEVLKDLFDTARAFSDGPSMGDLNQLFAHTNVSVEVVDAAREYVEAGDYENVPDDMTMSEVTELDVDDDDGPDMELKQVGEGDPDDGPEVTPVGEAPAEADGESEDDPGDPPEVPEDDPDDVTDGELGDFDPSADE